jgi:enoyl-CoA hydratase
MALWSMNVDGGIAVATYENLPMNYMCADGVQELARLADDWRDPSIRAIVLCGRAGGGFITHYSVEELLGLASDREAMRLAGTAVSRNYHAVLFALCDLPKVVIAAMNGNTMGGGFELSLACDIRVGQKGDYRYGQPEVCLGILPGGGGTQRLSRLIGAGRAIEFILRSRIVDPDTALSLGLIHELADDALARAKVIAAEVAALPPMAVACAKRAVYAGSDAHLSAGLEIESSAFLETMESDDARCAMQAYVDLPFDQRREWLEHGAYPKYSGR